MPQTLGTTADTSWEDRRLRYHLSRQARWRQAVAATESFLVVAMACVFLALISYVLIYIAIEIPDYLEYLRGEKRGDDYDLLTRVRWALYRSFLWLPLYIYVTLYILPFVLTLPLCAPLIVLWTNPARFLIFRPFNRNQLAGPLRRVLKTVVAPLGHVYTLSDADIKVPWYVRVPLVFGQLALLSFRMRQIRSTRAIERLDGAISRTWLRNINWSMGWGKVFPIACSDAYWREFVTDLVPKMDVLFIDITDLRENVIWEVNLCRELGVEDRIIYLVRADQSQEARRWLAIEMRSEAAAPPQIFEFGQGGLTRRDAFRARLIELVMKSSGVKSEPGPLGLDRLSLASTLLFSLGMYPLFILSSPGFGKWVGFPRWTPWEHPAYWPGFAAVLNYEAGFVLAFGVVTFFLLILTQRRNRLFAFLVVVQTLLLLAAPIGMLDW